MANEFVEARLELGLNYGASYGPRFATAISTQANGGEYRRSLWDQPLIYATVGDRQVTDAELDYLLEFHDQTMGSYRGFRLRDWSDYKCTGGALWGDGGGNYQACKIYAVGATTILRPLTRLVADTVQLFANGTPATSGQYSVDLNTGVLTTGLTGSLSVDCEFDVPVRFEQDKIDFTYEAMMAGAKIFKLAPLTCTELRQLPAIAPDLTAVPAHLASTIDLGHDYGTLGGPAFSTRTASTASEFEDRKFFWTNPKHSFDIGDRPCNRADIAHLLSFFRVCRGRATSFVYYDHQTDIGRSVRFAEDRISFRFDAHRSEDGESIFNLGGIALMEIFDGF